MANHPTNPPLSLMSEGVNPQKIAFLRQYLERGFTADLGCGNGLYGTEIQLLTGRVIQIDIVDRRNEESRCFPFLSEDVLSVDYEALDLHNAVAFDLIEHLDDDAALLQKLRRHVRGRLVLSVPNADLSVPARVALTHKHKNDRTHRREYSPETLSRLLMDCGFRVLEIRPHRNDAIWNAADMLRRSGFVSRLGAKAIGVQCRLLGKLGVLENECVADWFCAAE